MYAIEFDHVWKSFKRGERATSLRDAIPHLFKKIVTGSTGQRANGPTDRTFWALKDVSFKVKRGEVLGIIGPNGAGKTTILKMLAGIMRPNKGSLKVNGRVSALIEVGAGFHPDLTGRENIYLNGSIMGMTKKEIDKKFDSIVDFAGSGLPEFKKFIDTPVKRYSSGMYVRLGFSIAAHVNPEILLVDEVLAVGDVEFRAKCYNRIAELIKNCAAVLVSHNMPAISRICSKCIVLNNGHLIFQGTPEEAIQHYYSLFDEEKMATQHPVGSGEAGIERMKIYRRDNKETETFQYGAPMTISFDAKVSPKYETFLVSITVINQGMQVVAQCHSGYNNVVLKNDGHSKNIQVTIPKILLNPGKYTVNIIIFDKTNQRVLAWHRRVKEFRIAGEFVGSANVQLLGIWEVR